MHGIKTVLIATVATLLPLAPMLAVQPAQQFHKQPTTANKTATSPVRIDVARSGQLDSCAGSKAAATSAGIAWRRSEAAWQCCEAEANKGPGSVPQFSCAGQKAVARRASSARDAAVAAYQICKAKPKAKGDER